MQSMYEAGTRSVRGYEAARRAPKGYKAATRGVMWVQGNYKRCEAGMRQLQGV